MANKGFTKVDNSVLLDSNLSLEAKALYAIIKHLSTIPGFSIRREYVKSLSGYGETAFRRVWKELKEKGLLIETKLRNKGKYDYKYAISEDIKEKDLVKETKPKHIDSDGNKPLQGQLDIEDLKVNQPKAPKINEEISAVVEATGFTNTESVELLEITENSVIKIMEAYKYVKAQRNVKSMFDYTKWVIKNAVVNQYASGSTNKRASTFNNFKHREYDFKRLEAALLYGEAYELPA